MFGFNGEDALHLFVNCWNSRFIWNCLRINFWADSHCSNITDWIWLLLHSQGYETICRASVAVWVMWKNRNDIIHGKHGWTLEQCVLKIESTLSLSTSYIGTGRSRPEDGIIIQPGGYIFFCDGSWSSFNGMGSIAAIGVKDALIIGCTANFEKSCVNAVHTEILSLVSALEMAATLGSSDVVLCSDSSEALWILQNGFGGPANSVLAVRRGHELIQLNPTWRLSHIFREKNYMADFIAKKARAEEWNWKQTDCSPRCLQDWICDFRRDWAEGFRYGF